MSEITDLTYGIEIDGKVYKTVAVRIPVMADIWHAMVYADETTGSTEGWLADLAVKMATVARIISIGGVPQEKITPALLEQQLLNEDYYIIDSVCAALKKKRAASTDSTPQG